MVRETKWESPRSGAPDKRKTGKKRSSFLILSITLLLALLHPAAVLFGASVDEEELIERDVIFSIPRPLAEDHRRIAIESGSSFLTGASLFGGTDNNAHRSPADLKQSSEPWGQRLYLRSDMRFDNESVLITTANWKKIDYPDQTDANFRRTHIGNWLSFRLSSGLELNLDFDLSIKNDDATIITGESYTRDYSYYRTAEEMTLVWHPFRHHRIKFGGEFIQKDYAEKGGLNSIDWNLESLKFRYRYRIGAYHYISLMYSRGTRRYRDEPASLRDGTEPPGNPNEKHRYTQYMIGYAKPIARWLNLNFKYEYRAKDDLFEGYESRDSHVFSFWTGINLKTRLELSLESTYEDRDYRNLPGDNEPLEYVKWVSGISLRYRVFNSLWMFGNLKYFDRDTNLSAGLSYRGYDGMTTSVGASFFFLN